MQSSRLIPTAPLALAENRKLEQKMLALLQVVAGGTPLPRPQQDFTAQPPSSDWIVFTAEKWSLGVWFPKSVIGRSRISLALHRLRVIQTVQNAIVKKAWPPCELINVDVLEDGWTFFQFGGCAQAIWMAVQGELPDGLPLVDSSGAISSAISSAISRAAPRGRFGVYSTISVSNSLCMGQELSLGPELPVTCRSLRISGVMKIMECGGINMEVVKLNSSGGEGVEEIVDRIAIQVEIGSIELAVADLFALRVGSSIELSRPQTLTCSLRIGDAAFAMGELSVRERDLVLRVVEILDAE